MPNNFSNTQNTFVSLKAAWKKYEFTIQNTRIQNLVYYTSFEKPNIESKGINILQFFLFKHFVFNQKWNWVFNFCYQPQNTIINNVHLDNYVPLPEYWTFSRFYYAKRLNSKSMFHLGFELFYNSPYKAPNYSPLLGKFVVQTSSIIENYPTLNVFFNLKIRNFYLNWKIENINTISFKNNTIYYTNNNFTTPNLISNELCYKFGIWWDWLN